MCELLSGAKQRRAINMKTKQSKSWSVRDLNTILNIINKFNLQHTRRTTFIYAALLLLSSSSSCAPLLRMFRVRWPQNKQLEKSLKLQVACFMAAGLQNLSHLPRFLMRRNKSRERRERERESAREREYGRDTYFNNSQVFIDWRNYSLNLLHFDT